VTDYAGLMLAEFLMRGAICVDVCEVSCHSTPFQWQRGNIWWSSKE